METIVRKAKAIPKEKASMTRKYTGVPMYQETLCSLGQQVCSLAAPSGNGPESPLEEGDSRVQEDAGNIAYKWDDENT